MTLDDVSSFITRIKSERDPNRQHTIEYYLYKHFIRHVAETAPVPYQTLAQAILKTEELRIGSLR